MRRAVRFVTLAREHKALSALGFVDVDDFKALNDRFGHPIGDRALTVVAKTLLASLGGDGIVGRLGGDEFCFLLFTKDMASFLEATQHIEKMFCRVQVDVGAGKAVPVTSSVGIVSLESTGPLEDLEQVLKSADALMYTVKRAGKGRCATRASRAA
jgi:diguanylate cyclase (GGDEF)-like protein